MTLTLILWLVLGAVSMGGMLHVAAHKTVVISARGQEQGEIVPEYRTGENERDAAAHDDRPCG